MRPWTILGAAVLALVPLACRDEPDTTLYPERIEPAPQATSKTSAEERAATPEATMRPGAARDSRDSGVAAAHFPRNCQSVFRVDVPALMKVPGARDELLPTFLGTTARDEKKPTAQDPARDTPDERDAKAADETKARDENKAANEHEGATTSKKTSDDMKAADDVKAQKTAEEKAPAKTAPKGAQEGKGAETAAPLDLPAILADAGLDPEKDVKEVAFCTLATADGPHVEQPSLPPGQQGQHGGSPTPKTQLDQPTKELPAAKDAQRSTTPPPTGEPIPSSSARAKTDKPSTKAAKETEVVIIVVPTTASGAAMKLIEARKLDKRDVAGAVAAQDAERHYYVGESGDGAIILAKSEMALRDALHVTEPASCPLGHDTAMSLCMMDDPLGAAMGSREDKSELEALLPTVETSALQLASNGRELVWLFRTGSDEKAAELAGAFKALLQTRKDQAAPAPMRSPLMQRALRDGVVTQSGDTVTIELAVPEDQTMSFIHELTGAMHGSGKAL